MGVGRGASRVASCITRWAYRAPMPSVTRRQAVSPATPLACRRDRGPCQSSGDNDALARASTMDSGSIHRLGFAGRLREAAGNERARAKHEAIIASRQAVVGVEHVIVGE